MAPASNAKKDVEVSYPPRLAKRVEKYLKRMGKDVILDDTDGEDDDDDDVTIVQVTQPQDEDEDDGNLAPDINVTIWDLDWNLVPISHIFLTNLESVLLIVFDLCQDLSAAASGQMTVLDQLIFWMNSFYHKAIFAGVYGNSSSDSSGLSVAFKFQPNIVVIGVNKQALHQDSRMRDKIVSWLRNTDLSLTLISV